MRREGLEPMATYVLWGVLFWGGVSVGAFMDRHIPAEWRRVASGGVLVVHGLLLALALVATWRARRRWLASRASLEGVLHRMGKK